MTARTTLSASFLFKVGVCLCLAAVMLGCHYDRQTTPPARSSHAVASVSMLFRDAAASSGLNFHWGHTTLQRLSILETSGHGCAFLDYDGDGKLDILLVGSSGARLYHNQGNGAFVDVTEKALPKPPPNSHFLGCAVADYDGDSHPDIFLTGYGSTALYHNEGNGAFRDVTTGSGLEARGPYDWTTSAAWADVDGDGRLNLYVCRYVGFTPSTKQLCSYKALDGGSVLTACAPTTYTPLKGSLYRNLGNGRFRDITHEAGLDAAHGDGLGCMFCDINGDGKPDLYISNDVKPCDLFLNTGGAHFKNIGVEAGVAFGADGTLQSGMGVDWGDYDNDGRFDLLAANFAGQPKSLYHNEGQNQFSNVSYSSGIGAGSLPQLAFGAAFIDVDNDGRLDIVFTNGHVQSEAEKIDGAASYFQSTQLFLNQGGGRFQDATVQAGPDFVRKIVGRGVAVGDYDGDGREDLLIVNEEGAPLLLHNESLAPNHWLTLQCLWGAKQTDAVGARVTITLSNQKRVAEVRAGGSYLSTNAPEIHFGLGAAKQVDALQIHWPDGRESRYRNVRADHAYRASPASLTLSPVRSPH